MSSAGLLLEAFFVLCAVGTIAAPFLPDRDNPSVLAGIAALAALVIMAASGDVLLSGVPFHAQYWEWLPPLGPLSLELDPLGAVFLFVVGMIFLPVSIFSATYLRKYAGHDSLRYFSLLYHPLFASIVFILIAHDIFSFLVAWEFMSVLSYLLVNYEIANAESARAGFVMLAMSEAGTVLVAAAFLLLANGAGKLDFDAIRAAAPSLGPGLAWAVFFLSFFGFAVKAGLVPVNSWLPLAHPVAPVNVSALLSAVIVNLGIYGITRVNLDLLPPRDAAAGLIVLSIGGLSALIGILYATIQTELKRLLAHSTIENMGIVAAGLGAGMTFLATHHPVAAGIALITAFYHMANHALYKALLFVGTGAVEAGAHSRDLDRLGGLARRMPWTSALFLVGVLAISALPPLNGFVSEWLTLQTILRAAVLSSAAVKIVFAIVGAALALTAGLAVTCFVKAFAMGFLGVARSDSAKGAREAHFGMRAPMALLAILCVLFGVLPTYMIPTLDHAVSPLTHASAADALVPPFFTVPAAGAPGFSAGFIHDFHALGAQVGRGVLPGRGLVVLHQGGASNPVVFAMSTSWMLVVLALLLALAFVAFRFATRRRSLVRRAAWDGGLRRLLPGMTYTATGFSNPVRVVFQAILRPATVEDSTEAVAQHFRTAIRRTRQADPVIDRLFLWPPVLGLAWLAGAVRRLHAGPVNTYAAYVLITVLIVLVIGVRML